MDDEAEGLRIAHRVVNAGNRVSQLKICNRPVEYKAQVEFEKSWMDAERELQLALIEQKAWINREP